MGNGEDDGESDGCGCALDGGGTWKRRVVLSGLYLAPIIRLFYQRSAELGVDLISYVDDGTLLAQSKDVATNCIALRRAYTLQVTESCLLLGEYILR